MSKVLFIGDPHLKITRFDLAMRFLKWLDTLIAEQKPDMVVNLGDTFDTHAVLRSEVMTEFMKHVYRTIDQKIEYVYLLGNHDMYKPNDPKYHAMLPYKDKIPGLVVIDETRAYKNITFVPYQYNGSTFPRKTLPICVAHQTFIGADYGPIRTTEGVDATSIEGCEILISGHIHTKSVLGRVLYVGSPFSQSASDIDQVKGITILDTDTFQYSFHECPLPMWRRCVLEVSSANKPGDVLNLLSGELSRFPRDHWVVEVTGPRAEVVGLLNSDDYKNLAVGIDVKVKTKFTDSEKKKISIQSRSMEHIISEYVAKVYNGSIDKKRLFEYVNTVLTESRHSK